MCIGIIRNNSLAGGRTRAESTQGQIHGRGEGSDRSPLDGCWPKNRDARPINVFWCFPTQPPAQTSPPMERGTPFLTPYPPRRLRCLDPRAYGAWHDSRLRRSTSSPTAPPLAPSQRPSHCHTWIRPWSNPATESVMLYYTWRPRAMHSNHSLSSFSLFAYCLRLTK